MTEPSKRAAVLEARLVFYIRENDSYVLLEMEETGEKVLKHIISKTPPEAIAALNTALTTGDFSEWHDDQLEENDPSVGECSSEEALH